MTVTDWTQAQTLTDLGQLTAAWLLGELDWHPNIVGDGGPDPETSAITEHLIAANYNGYVTTFSQPAEPLADGWAQRAAVAGICGQDTLDRLKATILGTDLILVATPFGLDNPTQIPVTIDNNTEHTWIGAAFADELPTEHYTDACPNLDLPLEDLWQVDICDPHWGRTNLLWDTLDTAWAAFR